MNRVLCMLFGPQTWGSRTSTRGMLWRNVATDTRRMIRFSDVSDNELIASSDLERRWFFDRSTMGVETEGRRLVDVGRWLSGVMLTFNCRSASDSPPARLLFVGVGITNVLLCVAGVVGAEADWRRWNVPPFGLGWSVLFPATRRFFLSGVCTKKLNFTWSACKQTTSTLTSDIGFSSCSLSMTYMTDKIQFRRVQFF